MKKTNLLTCIALLTLLSACNTIAGAGKDVSAGGQDVTHAANHD